jgi:uncharacterized protein YbjT (DUF2867 family)
VTGPPGTGPSQTEPPPVLVTGATGTVGREVAAQLAAAGHAVRALVRDPGAASPPAGVELARGDLSDPAGLAAALDGVRDVFLVWPFTAPEATAELAPGVVKVLAQQDRRVVYLSAAAAATQPATSWARLERLIEDSGASWTFLRSAGLAKNTLLWAGQIRAGDVVRWPYAASARALIHEADLAAVAVRALTGPGHAGQAYVLTGPQTLSQAEQVRAIGAALGRPLRFEEVPAAAVRPELVSALGSEAFADGALDSWARFITEPEDVTAAVPEITGVPARTLESWARDHAAGFR